MVLLLVAVCCLRPLNVLIIESLAVSRFDMLVEVPDSG